MVTLAVTDLNALVSFLLFSVFTYETEVHTFSKWPEEHGREPR